MAEALCERCRAHEDAIPTDEQLRRMVSGVSIDDDRPYDPMPRTPGQEAAARMYAYALVTYIKEFGVPNAVARLGVTYQCLQVSATFRDVFDRQLLARRYINDRADFAENHGDADEAERIRSEPTPDYPGKDRDDAILDRGRNESAAEYELQARGASYLAQVREFAEDAQRFGEIMREPEMAA